MFIRIHSEVLSSVGTIELHNVNEYGNYVCDSMVPNVQRLTLEKRDPRYVALATPVVGSEPTPPEDEYGYFAKRIQEHLELLALQLAAIFPDVIDAEATRFDLEGFHFEWKVVPSTKEVDTIRNIVKRNSRSILLDEPYYFGFVSRILESVFMRTTRNEETGGWTTHWPLDLDQTGWTDQGPRISTRLEFEMEDLCLTNMKVADLFAKK